MHRLLSQKSGNLFINVRDDAEVVIISKENSHALQIEIPKLERY